MRRFLAAVVLAALAAGPVSAQLSVPADESASQSRLQQVGRDDVQQIQERLKQLGYFQGDANGLLDEQTQQSLAQFQQDRNVGTSGRIDAETLAALGVEPDSQQAEIPAEGGDGSGTAR